jgi:hypothetical protein
MIRPRLLPLLLLATCLSQPLLAQINPFRGSKDVPLGKDDISALTEATNHLLDQTRLVAGDSQTWSSPSGTSGDVTAGNMVHRQGLVCRVMNYRIRTGASAEERTRALTWCKTKDGWKIG